MKIYDTCVIIIMLVITLTFVHVVFEKMETVSAYKATIETQNAEIKDLHVEIKNLEMQITRTAEVKVTVYAPELRGINSDSDHSRTAIMDKPVPGWTCAISRDLVGAGWLGKKIWIKGIGIRYASDIMAESYNGRKIEKQIDICVGKEYIKTEAKKIGDNKRLATAL